MRGSVSGIDGFIVLEFLPGAKKEFLMRRGFTIVELLVAMALLAAMIAASGAVFHMAIGAYRTASATAEIARKLRVVTEQLNADFKGLRRDGEIYVAYVARPVDVENDGAIDYYERFDRIVFFADGDFQAYGTFGSDGTILKGNLARISYMLAKDWGGREAYNQEKPGRILARSQHIVTADGSLAAWPVLAALPATFVELVNSAMEYQTVSFDEWNNIADADKYPMLGVATGVEVLDSTAGDGQPALNGGGLWSDDNGPLNVQMLFCEGVGEFKIQWWDEAAQEWRPEVDRVPGDGSLITDGDFPEDMTNPGTIDLNNIPTVFFKGPGNMMVDPPVGTGRALKFTFTLYDSRGIFTEGKTFTHIIYLDR